MQLQSGYPGQTFSPTITLTAVRFTSTTLAANTGVITINYTSWDYTIAGGGGWKSSYTMASNAAPGLAIKVTNNDPTRTFYLSNKTSIVFTAFSVGTQASTSSSSFVLTNVTSTAGYTKYTCTGFPVDDYCTSIGPGQTLNLSLGGNGVGAGATALSNVPNRTGPTTAFLLVYGKFDTSRSGNAAVYAQNIPFIALYLT